LSWQNLVHHPNCSTVKTPGSIKIEKILISSIIEGGFRSKDDKNKEEKM
jgi:hypothetical protein